MVNLKILCIACKFVIHYKAFKFVDPVLLYLKRRGWPLSTPNMRLRLMLPVFRRSQFLTKNWYRSWTPPPRSSSNNWMVRNHDFGAHFYFLNYPDKWLSKIEMCPLLVKNRKKKQSFLKVVQLITTQPFTSFYSNKAFSWKRNSSGCFLRELRFRRAKG